MTETDLTDAPTDNAPPLPPAAHVPLWLSVTGILVGIGFVAMALFLRDLFERQVVFEMTICIGFGLVLTGFGTQAAGTWRSWSVAGSGAAAVLLFLLLQFTGEEQVEEPPKVVHAEIDGGFHPTTEYVQGRADDGARLLGTWKVTGQTFVMQIEENHIAGDGCIDFITQERGTGPAGTEEEGLDEDGTEIADAGEFASSGRPDRIRDVIAQVPNQYFGDQFDTGEPLPPGMPLKVRLHYDHQVEALLDPNSQKPLNCGPQFMIGSAPERPKDFAHWTDILGSRAFAGEPKFTISDLLDGLESRNSLVRREARQMLSERGLEAIEAMMAALANRPSYRTQLGVANALSRYLGRGGKAEAVRKLLDKGDVNRLTRLIAHRDKTMRQNATAALVRLADPRSVAVALRILGDKSRSANGRYNAAYLLNRIFPSLDAATRKRLVRGVDRVRDAQGPRTQELLRTIVEYVERPRAPETAWTYLGVNYGKGWAQLGYRWEDGESTDMPEPGTKLVATEDADLFVTPLKFDKKRGWVRPATIGKIASGEAVEIVAIEEVGHGLYWAKVRRTR